MGFTKGNFLLYVLLRYFDVYNDISVVLISLFSTIYRFKSDEERTPVQHIVGETFPHLLNIFNRLVQIANPSIEVADLIKLICKIFWSSIYVS